MGILAPVNLEFSAQSQPFFIYENRTIAAPIERFAWRIDYGFGYLLRRIVTHWTTQQGSYFNPFLRIELFDTGTGKARQVQSIPLDLITTPNRVSINSPKFGNFEQGAGVRGSSKILNWYYPYGDTIEARITGQVFAPVPVAWRPVNVGIMLEGYYVPEKSLGLWDRDPQSSDNGEGVEQ